MTTLKRSRTFHKRKGVISKVILSQTDKHEIIYGARALNKRFPKWLDKPTQDYDIYSKTPRKDAKQVERALDKRFKGDHFYTEPAQHKGTWKVKAHANQEGYADYTKPEGKIPYKTIGGKNYVALSHVKKNIKKTLKDKESAYRHAKDRDALNRINLYEQIKKKKKSVKRKTPMFSMRF
jgi:hypothetical protein